MANVDPDSETWRETAEWAKNQIKIHRNTLETIGLGPVETELARGYILALRGLLKLGEPSKILPPGSSAT